MHRLLCPYGISFVVCCVKRPTWGRVSLQTQHPAARRGVLLVCCKPTMCLVRIRPSIGSSFQSMFGLESRLSWLFPQRKRWGWSKCAYCIHTSILYNTERAILALHINRVLPGCIPRGSSPFKSTASAGHVLFLPRE